MDQSRLKLPRDEEHSQKFADEERYFEQAAQVTQVGQNVIIFARIEPADTACSQIYLKVIAFGGELTQTSPFPIVLSICLFEQFLFKFVLIEDVEYFIFHADCARGIVNIGRLFRDWVEESIVAIVADIGNQFIAILCKQKWQALQAKKVESFVHYDLVSEALVP